MPHAGRDVQTNSVRGLDGARLLAHVLGVGDLAGVPGETIVEILAVGGSCRGTGTFWLGVFGFGHTGRLPGPAALTRLTAGTPRGHTPRPCS